METKELLKDTGRLHKNSEIIGRNKYNAYKEFDLNDLSDENLEKINLYFNKPVGQILREIKIFEDHHKITDQKEKTRKYFKEAQRKQVKELPVITKKILWHHFLKAFYSNEGKEFQLNDTTIENIKPLIYYFLDDFENFSKCRNVQTEISAPNLQKGLLIVGDYGCGKTSVMNALHTVMQKVKGKRFAKITANDLVNRFEACENNKDKEDFFNWFYKGRIYIDDVKTERLASNYGKVNVIKDGLEVRHSKRLKTYLTCNFSAERPDDLAAAIIEFREKYGNRVYDRLFEDFNFIIFRGKSYRK